MWGINERLSKVFLDIFLKSTHFITPLDAATQNLMLKV